VSEVVVAATALRAGGVAVVPTDTVYGLACAAEDEMAARRLAALKGRGTDKPIAVVAADVDAVLRLVPELRGPSEAAMRAVLPGGLTLVLPNPARRLRWLGASRPETIGVRVPAVEGVAAELLELAGPIAATSANLAGGPDPRRLADVPRELRVRCDAVVDGGTLPGAPSTVVDLTGARPAVLREGAVAATEVLSRLTEADRR
jgi:L-threonylcarbamoyladenylate synthase